MRLLAILYFWLCIGHLVYAGLLPADQAFQFSVQPKSQDQVTLVWNIQPGYYLYQQKISVQQNHTPIQLKLPQAQDQYDENFGHSKVYWQQLSIDIHIDKNKTYHVMYQGCAKDQICYAPQSTQFKTDESGLILNQSINNVNLGRIETSTIQQSSLSHQMISKTSISDHQLNLQNQPNQPKNEQVVEIKKHQDSLSSKIVAQDQHWLNQLKQHSFAYTVLLFLGLGCLLAFTPCSLPMIPILSSLLIREHKGVKAWTIALVFVVSMASVYAIMGFIASHTGLSLQRWLQQPMTVIAFAILFIIFALNLFGLFEIKLPNRIVQRLDHWQSLQQGGTLVSAGIMGVLSALLVGPCMTAPLAGILLFIIQSEYQWQGALLLFSLGFGMGIPLLLVSVLGESILPKAGQWMHQVKIFFGFIMLGLALYFIRPLMINGLYQILMTLLGFIAVAYLFHQVMWRHQLLKISYAIMMLLSVSAMGYYHYHEWISNQAQQPTTWHIVHNADELSQQLAQAKGQKILIDIYADWCVACQPINRLFQQEDIQTALQDRYLIKLDLSEYDSKHQQLLNHLDVLGPPTVIFLNEQGDELRELRLVGHFTHQDLMQRLVQF